MLYDATGIQGLFDTAGWTPQNIVMQKRMETLADYYSDPEHTEELGQLNVSLNPYHGIMEMAYEYRKNGDLEGYERGKNIYTKNIANAMYTFTPLLDTEIYQIFLKALDDSEDKEFNDYKKKDFLKLMDKAFETLENRYKDDLKKGNHKFVKNEQDIMEIMQKQKNACSDIINKFGPSARNNKFSNFHREEEAYFSNKPKANFQDISDFSNSDGLIDMNGKVYLHNNYETFATDLTLNFKNKDKETKQIKPVPEKRTLHILKETFN